MEKHLNSLDSESLKVGLKIHKEKAKYMTNHADSEDMPIDQEQTEKVTAFKYLGQTTHLKDTTKEEIYARMKAAAGSCFRKNKKILQDRQLPFHSKKQVMDQPRVLFPLSLDVWLLGQGKEGSTCLQHTSR